ncbi:MAG TPA: hypothetical protein O0X58_00885 [Methanocorpusculum sp.]|nr:hypothetical protein [Methanocorpusculum sp.]HJJ72903.1 hypothetical protein [Methanocorpusculum sp.]
MNTKTLLKIFSALLLLSLFTAAVSAGSPAVEEAIDNGLDFIAKYQNTDGGFLEPNMKTSAIGSTWFVS